MKKKPTRRQHIVPAFYLSEFTMERTRRATFFAFNPTEATRRPTKPDTAAFVNNFYDVEFGAGTPFSHAKEIENFLDKRLEAPQSRVLREIERQRCLPARQTEEFEHMIWMAASLHARTPKARRAFVDSLIREGRDILRASVSSPETWAQTLRQNPALAALQPNYEDMQRVADTPTVEIRGRNWHSNVLILSTLHLYDELVKRTWSLVVAADGATDFVTSDSPGHLHWMDLGDDTPLPDSPDVLSDSRLAFYLPLTRRLLLLGVLPALTTDYRVDTPMVGAINARIVLKCERFVYGAADDFTITIPWRGGHRAVSYWDAREFVKGYLHAAGEANFRKGGQN